MLVDYMPDRREIKREGAFQINDQITLWGGFSNIVDDEVWDRAMQNPTVKRILSHMMEIEGSIRITHTDDPIALLTSQDESTALKKLFNTVNIETLEEWKAAETRKEIKAEIEHQIADVTQPGKVDIDMRDRRRKKLLAKANGAA